MQEETRQAAEELKLKEVSLKEQSEENLHTISDLTRTLNLRAEEVAALEEAVDHGTNQRKKLMHEVQSLAAERDRLNAQVCAFRLFFVVVPSPHWTIFVGVT